MHTIQYQYQYPYKVCPTLEESYHTHLLVAWISRVVVYCRILRPGVVVNSGVLGSGGGGGGGVKGALFGAKIHFTILVLGISVAMFGVKIHLAVLMLAKAVLGGNGERVVLLPFGV